MTQFIVKTRLKRSNLDLIPLKFIHAFSMFNRAKCITERDMPEAPQHIVSGRKFLGERTKL